MDEKSKIKKAIIIIFLALGSIVVIIPFLWMLVSAFKPNIEILTLELNVFKTTWTLDNFRRVLFHDPLPRAYLNSIIIGVSITAFTVFTSTCAGYLLAKFKFRGRDALFMLIMGSIMIPHQAAVIPLYFLAGKLNILNTYSGLVFPFIMAAFHIFLVRQFMYGIPDEVLEAARVDGASEWRILFKIVFPLAKPVISVVGILTLLHSLDELLWPLVVVNTPDMQTLSLILARYTQSMGGPIPGPTAAATSFIIVPVLIAYMFFQRFFVKGITMTGLKG